MTQLVFINTNPARRVLVPFVRCKIGEDIFQTGDGGLMSASVTLGEGDRASRCSFEIYDSHQWWANKYFKASYSAGGLAGLGPPPNKAATGGGATTGLGNFAGGNATATEKAIVAECLRQGVTDKAQIAYILATAKHESDGYATREEYSSGEQYEGRTDLGNTQPGDGVRFKGRGYVQVTGRDNYQKYSQILGKDFAANPAQMADPDVSLFTLVHGMKNGTFTTARLSEYVGGGRQDFVGARAVVNGNDRADLIAGYANDYLTKVDGLMQGQAPPAPAKPAPPKEETPAVENADKGAQITIWMGFEPDQLVEFAFIHTGTRFQGMSRNTTSFEGQSVRWLMTRRIKNTAYQKITLRQLADKVAKSYGLTLLMEGDGPKYEYLDQTGISDYKLLQRECDRIGYRLYDRGANLVVEARKNQPLGFVLEYGVNLDSFEVSDQAQTDSGGGGTASQPQATSSTGELKTIVEAATGELKQERKENKSATGLADKGKPIATTGAATPAVAPKTDGVTDAVDKVQRDAAKRVHGFPGSASFTSTDAALTLNPDTPFLTEGHPADFLNRVWTIDTVTHDYQGGNLKTTVKFYSPMAPKYPVPAAVPGAPGTPGKPGAGIGATNPGGWAEPMKLGGNSSASPRTEFGYARGRLHAGLDYGGFGEGNDPDGVFASQDGVVDFVGIAGGYGNMVDIKHAGGWLTRYAHLASIDVSQGAQVKQGARVGTRGGTGDGGAKAYDEHLHFEIHQPNGEPVDPRSLLPQPGLQKAWLG